MKTKYLLLFLLLTFTLGIQAQVSRTDSTMALLKKYQFAHLKPIVVGANGRYYYGGVRLRSNYSLEIPFGELDDPEVNHYFKSARVIRTVGTVVSVLPTIYYLLEGGSANVSRRTFWATYLASIGVSLTANIISTLKIRRAVGVYNSRLAQPRVGLSLQNTPLSRPAVGFGITWNM